MAAFIYTFIKSVLFGIIITVLPGPILILIVQRTLANGVAAGLASGIGAITAYAVYALMAVMGLSFVTTLLLAHEAWHSLTAGLFLLYLGITAYRQKVTPETVEIQRSSLVGAFLATFILAIINPVSILSSFYMKLTNPVSVISKLFAGIGISASQSDLLAMVTGVTLGATFAVMSAVWFIGFLRHKLSPANIIEFNKLCSVLLFMLAIPNLIMFGVSIWASVFLT